MRRPLRRSASVLPLSAELRVVAALARLVMRPRSGANVLEQKDDLFTIVLVLPLSNLADATDARAFDQMGLNRFVLAFGWGDSTEIERDWSHEFESLLRERDLTLRYIAAFPTHVRKTWGRSEGRGDIETGYFCMFVLELSPIS